MNFGVWYRHFQDKARIIYQEDLELFQKEWRLFTSQNPSSFVFFRESVTQHFDTSTGEYTDGAHLRPCIQMPARKSSFNLISEKVLSALSLFYVSDQNVTLSRYNFHRRPSVESSNNYDCTHYCTVITLYESSWRYISLTLSSLS